MKWFRDAGVFILLLLVLTIIISQLPMCEGVAHAQKKTQMEKKAHDVLDGKSGGGDLTPLVVQPMELDIQETEKGWSPPEDITEYGRPVWYEYLVWIIMGLVGLFAMVMLLIKFFRRWRKARDVPRPAVDKTQCPACKKAVESAAFLRLPRIALQRRVFNIGSWQIVRPEVLEDQEIEVCPICYEYGLLKIRAQREKVMEDRAKDRRMEFDRLVEFQKGLLAEIDKARNPGNGDG